MASDYQQAVEWLDGLLRRKWRGGLDRMEALVSMLGLRPFVSGPERPLYFHVAGTNGKGSTTAFIESILLAHGIATGAAASPYVYDLRERVRMNGRMIPRDDLVGHVGALQAADDQLIQSPFGGASAFEMKTALGFLHWRERGARAVALEVGMGGRLDATNVVAPAACAIVSIGWDHMDVLGDTLGKIAAEKAGIIKPGIPIVAGAMEDEPFQVIRLRAAECSAPLWQIGREVTVCPQPGGEFAVQGPFGRFEGLRTLMYGPAQAGNAALAIACVAASGVSLQPNLVQSAIASAQWPGRFEQHVWRGVPVVLDGAHNQPAAANLAQTLRARFPGSKVGLVIGMLRGHNPESFLREVALLDGPIAAIDAPTPRGLKAEELALGGIHPCADPLAAAEFCLEDEAQALCFCGSYYILTGVKQALSLPPFPEPAQTGL